MNYRHLILCVVFCALCAEVRTQHLPKRIKRPTTVDRNSKSNNIQSLIRIDGYYPVDQLVAASDRPPFDTIREQVVFYEDGRAKLSYSSSPATLADTLHISKETCGLYQINGNIIKLQWVYRMPGKIGSARWDFNEERYRVIDDETILLISSKKQMKHPLRTYNAKFVPYGNLPSPDCWLDQELNSKH